MALPAGTPGNHIPAIDTFLNNKSAIVTGASRGIGRAIAVRLAQRGARVACVATSAENCAETVADCNRVNPQAGAESQAFGVDVAATEAVTALVKNICAEFGGLDLLVNNAGITRDGLILRMSESDYDRVLEVNLKGTWNFLRAASRPLMKARGRIINITSVVGITGNAGQANYAASKAGVIGLTRSLAKELAGRGVCVNAIAPGFIETDMTAGIDPAAAEQLTASIALGRIGAAEDIARAVEFLSGPGGDYITGQTLVVDGGLSL